MNYSRASSQVDLLEEGEDVLFLAVEEDGEHPYAHFPHCKAYLVLSLGWVVLITLTVPVAIGYARPALASFDFEPSQCKVLDASIKAIEDNNQFMECGSATSGKPIDYECAVRRAVREAKCEFAEIPLCFQKPCRCLSVKVDVITDGKKKKSLMLYDVEDTYLNYPMCSISPCSDDSVFEDLFTKIQVGNHNLRCFANDRAAIYNPRFRDSQVIVFGSLVLPLLLIVIWLCLTLYIMKRTWRVTRQDFKMAVEFRFNAWPPRPAQSIRASVPYTDTIRSSSSTADTVVYSQR